MTLSGNSLRQAVKFVAALLRVAGVTIGLTWPSSVKYAYFRKIRDFFVNFNAFTFICEGFRVLSAAFVRILMHATCHT